MSVSIINHGGSTSLLSKPAEAGGKYFPFHFQAVQPKDRSWSYRLLPPTSPQQLTEAQLIELLQADGSTLRADWEEQVGHPVGFITIYLPKKDGGTGSQQARFEQGPELGMDLEPPGLKPPQRKAPKPPPMEMDTF